MNFHKLNKPIITRTQIKKQCIKSSPEAPLVFLQSLSSILTSNSSCLSCTFHINSIIWHVLFCVQLLHYIWKWMYIFACCNLFQQSHCSINKSFQSVTQGLLWFLGLFQSVQSLNHFYGHTKLLLAFHSLLSWVYSAVFQGLHDRLWCLCIQNVVIFNF